MKPLINILIRSHRPHLLDACLKSIDYDNANVIVHQTRDLANGFDYNLYCNDLKDRVESGWFFYLDDDDTVLPGALDKIAKCLKHEPVICQFLRGNKPKPANELMDAGLVMRGKIGMPCIFMHARLRDRIDFDNTEYADYNYNKQVSL